MMRRPKGASRIFHIRKSLSSHRAAFSTSPIGESVMKTIRRSLTVLLLTVGAAACGASSITAPDCEDPAGCWVQPGTGNVQPGTGNVQPGTGNVQPGTGNVQPGTGNVQPGTGN